MARQARLTVGGYPHHVIARGNNRQPIVHDDEDRQKLLDLWAEHAQAFRVDIHAYVLMDNHFHLLLTPEDSEGVPRMMQAVGRAYVRWFNQRHQRSGTLWEGRYRSTLIESERYFLACMVYIDLNPVRAGMVASASDHPWSSHRHCVGMAANKWLKPHPLYWALGNTPFAREAAYAELVQAGLSARQQDELTHNTLKGWALGSEHFVSKLRLSTPRRLQPGKAGRPMKPHPGKSVPD